MSPGLTNSSRNRSVPCTTRELGAFVRHCDEMIGPLKTSVLQATAEYAAAIRLDCGTGLTGEQIQRLLGRRFGGTNRCRVCGIQHVQLGIPGGHMQDGSEDFGSEARSPHAKEHDMGKTIALHGVSKRVQAIDSSAICAGALSQPRRLAIFCCVAGSELHAEASRRQSASAAAWAVRVSASVAPASGPEKRRSEPRRRERLSAISRAGHIETRSSAPRISLAYYLPTETPRPRKSSIMR